MEHPEYRIPKIHVPLTCHTIQGEKLAGEIFLDVILTEGYNLEQVLDYFNTPTPFFPIRIGDEAPILLSKESVVQVEVPQLLEEFKQKTFSFSTRKEAVLHMHQIGSIRAIIIVDMPEDHSRILDMVTMAKRSFFPAIVNDSLSLVHIKHIYKIEGN